MRALPVRSGKTQEQFFQHLGCHGSTKIALNPVTISATLGNGSSILQCDLHATHRSQRVGERDSYPQSTCRNFGAPLAVIMLVSIKRSFARVSLLRAAQFR